LRKERHMSDREFAGKVVLVTGQTIHANGGTLMGN
jgi:hypothetical protein